jgi:hypothetical protein
LLSKFPRSTLNPGNTIRFDLVKLRGTQKHVITLTAKDRLTHCASWHEDQELNVFQGDKLGKDIVATRLRLYKETLQAHLGYVPAQSRVNKELHEVHEEKTGLVWVCWGETAIAVRTEPKRTIKDRIYSVTWYFKSLVKTEKN